MYAHYKVKFHPSFYPLRTLTLANAHLKVLVMNQLESVSVLLHSRALSASLNHKTTLLLVLSLITLF